MSPIQIAVMVIGAVGVFVGWSQSKKGAAWGQPVTIVCAIIAICAALWSSMRTVTGADMKDAQKRELEYQKVQTKKLGQFLAEKYAGKKVVLMKDPTIGSAPAQELPIIAGLKEGLGTALTIVAEIAPDAPKVPAGEDGEEMMEPIETWFDVKKLNETLAKAPDYDILITTCGLPEQWNYNKGLPGNLKGKQVVIAGGSIYNLGAPILKGEIIAAVTYKPNAEYDEKPVPSNLDEAFNKRYVLVTPEDIKQKASEYKDLFATGK
ncbi:MAG: hypothetical protein IJJ26_12870 [Victivallales bacterium]|nr:hypothetical protein [Victivallales bacterium]